MTSRGKCNFCRESFSASSIGRHLESCKRRGDLITTKARKGEGEGEGDILHVVVKGGDGLSMYWMHVEVGSDSTLRKFDDFLRRTWVECCGHLSRFIIEGRTYATTPDREFQDRSMNVKIGSVLRGGVEFGYDYDFGTTTTLDLKVLSSRPAGTETKKAIEILARNDPLEIRCGNCGRKLATNVCSECIWEGAKAWVCDNCSKRHECGEEMLLPVVNSPRVGMCGYTG